MDELMKRAKLLWLFLNDKLWMMAFFIALPIVFPAMHLSFFGVRSLNVLPKTLDILAKQQAQGLKDELALSKKEIKWATGQERIQSEKIIRDEILDKLLEFWGWILYPEELRKLRTKILWYYHR